jgi:hypothetical protein
MQANFIAFPALNGLSQKGMAMTAQYLRRKDAGQYLRHKFGFGSERTLAKLAVIGGGPVYRKAGAVVLYEPTALDTWAEKKIGAPRTSTSDIDGAR